MLNFVICDDNINTLNKLSLMFESIFMKHDLEAKIAFKTTNETELLSYLNENLIDVLILDINLNSTSNGIELAKILEKLIKIAI